MAKVTVKFSCGCGKQYSNLIEAGIHADYEQHRLNVQGEIVPDKPSAKNVQREIDKPNTKGVFLKKTLKRA